jgi:hypothetical protein
MSTHTQPGGPAHEHDEHDEHRHGHDHGGHGHSHGLIHDSIRRSSEGVRTVLISLAVLGLAAIARRSSSRSRVRWRCWLTSSTTSVTRSPRSRSASRSCCARSAPPRRPDAARPPLGAGRRRCHRLHRELHRRQGPHPVRRAPRQSRAHRRWSPRAGRRLRFTRGHRLGGRGRSRPAHCGSAHRPRHHPGHPAHHLAGLGDRPRSRPRALNSVADTGWTRRRSSGVA